MQSLSHWYERAKEKSSDDSREHAARFPFPLGMRQARRFHSVIAVVCLFGLVLWLFPTLLGDDMDSYAANAYNATLGFQKIFVISMPSRTDRHDSFAMAASFAGFEFEFIDGVDESTIVPHAIPPNWEKKEKGALGCRRAHLNVLQKMVRERIQSALILEDDADFDIHLKQQLKGLAKGVVALQPVPEKALRSPYGNYWDMLWLGYCMIGSGQSRAKFFITENDPTVAPIHKRHALFMDKRVPPDAQVNDTRLTFQAKSEGLCTYGLGFSYHGARKALAAVTQKPRPAQIDYTYQDLCRGSYEGVPFKCYSTYPPLFGSHRPSGSNARDTDIDRPYEYNDKWHDEYSFDVVYSTKINMRKLVKNNGTVTAQWPGDVKEPYHRLGTPHRTGKSYIKEVDIRNQPEKTVYGINNFPNSNWNVRPTTWE